MRIGLQIPVFTWPGGPAEIRERRELAELGVQQAIFNMPNVHEISPLEQFGKEIIPEVAGF